MLAEDFHFGYI